MSLTMAIFMLVGAWLIVAAAMLWGVLRIARRHHPHHTLPKASEPMAARRNRRHANVH